MKRASIRSFERDINSLDSSCFVVRSAKPGALIERITYRTTLDRIAPYRGRFTSIQSANGLDV